MAEKWTKTSWPPPSTLMNPKPLSELNHLTVPCATRISPCLRCVAAPRGTPAVNPRARHESTYRSYNQESQPSHRPDHSRPRRQNEGDCQYRERPALPPHG